MADKALSILHVNTMDSGGGAARVASNLSEAYREQGHNSWIAVGHKISKDPTALQLRHDTRRSKWARLCLELESQVISIAGNRRGAGRIASWLRWSIGQPRRSFERWIGHEDFDYPASHSVLDLPPKRPDIVHCHNLHGGYFDLNALQSLSKVVPVVLTLHDAWLLSGHCSHSFGCDRWITGCGACPDLSIYPAINRDGTVFNWRRKREIFQNSRLYVATPSHWLMEKVEKSILAPAAKQTRVINNGVQLSIFRPRDKNLARNRLNIPQDSDVLLFAADGVRGKVWRDYELMRAAVTRVAENLPDRNVIFIALGEDGDGEHAGLGKIRFVGHEPDPSVVASYYAAADVYLHAARADTFPTSVLEALACGTPVVATPVGGLPEQVRSLPLSDASITTRSLNGFTGMLTPEGDPHLMANAITRLLLDSELHKHLSRNALRETRHRFDLGKQVDKYLDWYAEIIPDWSRWRSNQVTPS